MRKLLIAVLAVGMLLLPQTGQAKEISRDKAMHMGASAAVEWYMAHNKPFCKWTRTQRIVANVAIVGGGKELYDSRHPDRHTAESGDLIADAVGAAAAEGVIWLYQVTW